MTYAELLADIESWLQRDDLTTQAPIFVRYATAALNRALSRNPVPQMESRVESASPVETEYIGIPDDCLRIRAIVDGDGKQARLATQAQIAQAAESNQSFDFLLYSLEDMQIRLYPAPSASDPVELTVLYYAKLSDFVSGTDTNWLLDEHPDVYLYGSLVHAKAWLHDDRRLQLVDQMYKAGLSEVLERRLSTPGAVSVIETDVPASRSGFNILTGV